VTASGTRHASPESAKLTTVKSRLKSVLTLLLSCLLLGASSQAAVCELACDLGSTVTCHGVATESMSSSTRQIAMRDASPMHCAGGMSSMSRHAADTDATGDVRVGALGDGRCTHPSQIAVVNSATPNNSFAAIHWIEFETIPLQPVVSGSRSSMASKPPPLRNAADPLLIALRV